jgi:uncharacterized protein (TIGR02145 family)
MKSLIISITILACIFASCKKEKTETPENEAPDSFIDSRDGQVYKCVKIGDQVWMAENLNYYTSSGSWYYNNDSATYSKPYGRLYLWETVMNGESASDAVPSGVKGICPNGWHLPSSAEFQVLDDYLDANRLNGNDLKATGTTYWKNSGGTNSTRFTAVGAGCAFGYGSISLNETAVFHTATGNSSTITGWALFYNNYDFVKQTNYNVTSPMCIRCLQD